MVLIAACSTVATSPDASISPAGSASIAPPTLAPLVDGPLPTEVVAELQSVLDGYVLERHDAPSISATVVVPGVGVWSGASGMADPQAARAATPDTVYAIGSITKMFVAALILRLAEEGLLSIDDPAADHLDSLAGPLTNGATVRQLLSQRSGIDEYLDATDEFRPWTATEILGVVGEPHFAAGTQYEYSSTNYFLLGLIAEGISGELLRPIVTAVGDVRMHISNGAASSFLDSLPLLHPFGILQCHDIFVTDASQYQRSFRGPGKYDGSVVNWVNGSILAAVGRRNGYDVEYETFTHRTGSNIMTMIARLQE